MGELIGNAEQDTALALSQTLAAPALAPTLSPEQAAALQPEVRDEARVSVAGTTREIPARIGRYLILRQLGEGGMGVVYSAYDAELDRKVAIKLLRANHEGSMGQARMRREAQAMAQLSHSHIVQVYEVGQDESLGQNGLFMAMEFVAGQPLSAWQTRLRADRTQLRPEDVGNCLRLYIQAGRGLLAAHSAGLVHRDFKPDNVLVGDDGRVRVADFGLARAAGLAPAGRADTPALAADAPVSGTTSALAATAQQAATATPGPAAAPPSSRGTSPRLTQLGSILGTPGYMSPEQVRGQDADARSDQFSFCAALHEALYGHLPFAGDTFEEFVLSILDNQRRPLPKYVQEIPLSVAQAIERGLSIDPSARFPSMAELLSCLEQGLESGAETPHSQRNRLLSVLILGSATLSGIVISWLSELPQHNTAMEPLLWITFAVCVPVATLGVLIRGRLRVNPRFRRFYFMIAISSAYMLASRLGSYHMGIPLKQHMPQELMGLIALGYMGCFFVSRRLLIVAVPVSLMTLVIFAMPGLMMRLVALIFPLMGLGSLYIALTEKHRAGSEASASQAALSIAD